MAQRVDRLPIRLWNAVQRGLERLGRAPARFADSEDALVAAAQRATGLRDLGDEEGFRPSLRVLLRAYDEEARLTPFGRVMVRGEITGVLSARLLSEAGLAADPSLREAVIRRPIFVLGLPRTGTTALHHLLAQDPANQVLEYWLAAAPGPRPARHTWERDPRFRAAAKALRMTYWLDPDLAAVHWLTPDGPDECRHLLLQSFLDHTFDSNATIPSYTKWLRDHDMHGAYARHRALLGLIQSGGSETRRWVLKYPAHMRNLDVLLETYPDACIVQTHRDPATVLPSLCSLVAGWRGLYEGSVDRTAVGRWQLDQNESWIRRALEVRDASDPSRFCDVDHDEIVADPVGAVARIYEHFGFELGGEVRARIGAWTAHNPPGRHGAHEYAAEDYGLTPGEIRERFAGYARRFGVGPE